MFDRLYQLQKKTTLTKEGVIGYRVMTERKQKAVIASFVVVRRENYLSLLDNIIDKCFDPLLKLKVNDACYKYLYILIFA